MTVYSSLVGIFTHRLTFILTSVDLTMKYVAHKIHNIRANILTKNKPHYIHNQPTVRKT